jgi:hypothetical protein
MVRDSVRSLTWAKALRGNIGGLHGGGGDACCGPALFSTPSVGCGAPRADNSLQGGGRKVAQQQ